MTKARGRPGRGVRKARLRSCGLSPLIASTALSSAAMYASRLPSPNGSSTAFAMVLTHIICKGTPDVSKFTMIPFVWVVATAPRGEGSSSRRAKVRSDKFAGGPNNVAGVAFANM